MNRNLQLALFAIAAALLAAIFLYPKPSETPAPKPPDTLLNILLPEPRPLTEFSLSNQDEQPLGLAQLQGKWSFVFFGYTHCPDICPTTLGILKGVAQKLEATPAISADTRFIFISVDPKRDSLPHLKEYIGYFNREFIAATGEREQIDKLARQLGAVYMFEGDTSRDDYIVNHSASVALVDPQGQWVARFNPPHTVKQFIDDYLQLRDYFKTASAQD